MTQILRVVFNTSLTGPPSRTCSARYFQGLDRCDQQQVRSFELFKIEDGIDIVHVPYKGTGPAMIDLVGGQIQTHVCGHALGSSADEAGRIRSLAVTSLQRRPDSPELPTVAETIVPGYEAGEWFALYGPAGMPKTLVAKINASFFARSTIPIRRSGCSPMEWRCRASHPISSENFSSVSSSRGGGWRKRRRSRPIEPG